MQKYAGELMLALLLGVLLMLIVNWLMELFGPAAT